MMYSALRNLFFRIDPETIHHHILHLASISPVLGKLTGVEVPQNLQTKVGSCQWKSPVGLAAGLDKDAMALEFLALQGFGAIECGTITLKPQSGNPRPRIFRYSTESSLRNAMGFPNSGCAVVQKNIRLNKNLSLPIGLNLGKNKDTTPEESIQELSELLTNLKADGDYFVINVSSPNTPGLRALQERGYLKELFLELNKIRSDRDLYLKISPDLDPTKIIELKELCQEMNLTGIIATNTTIMPERGNGGISGHLLKQKARSVHELILKENSSLEFIAVGGIDDFDDILHLWKQGGKSAQIYTSYIYQGPGVLKNIYRGLEQFLSSQGLRNVEDFFTLQMSERKERIEAYELSFKTLHKII